LGEDAEGEEEEEEVEGGADGAGGKVELPEYLKRLPEHQRRAYERGKEGGREGGVLSVGEGEVHEKDRKLFEKLRGKAAKIENMEEEIRRIYAKENSQVGGTREGMETGREEEGGVGRGKDGQEVGKLSIRVSRCPHSLPPSLPPSLCRAV
jgi:hypothetical protein